MPRVTKLVLLRHGPTAWTQSKRLQGRRDIPLSERGREAVAGWHMPPWTKTCKWYVSPLVRARETAALLGASDAVVEPCLIEMNWASWEGLTLAGLRQELGGAMEQNEARGLDFRPDGGESPRDVQIRLEPWLADLRKQRRPTIAVTHKGVIRAVMAKATGWDMIGKPPARTKWGALHIFHVDAAGNLEMGTPVWTAAPS